ncbi:zinc finger transcription factor [Niveomyces insectorum RCEF 264]|uniref:Zinc finger transcription factor n=1 Tax=Niveomyces insectorum RCEF 264 TaxID=1081102 RepID=A0A167W3I6_9HYPO|nr:zinc finger transcription factor [Niveomyces insectorum RCEF 264]
MARTRTALASPVASTRTTRSVAARQSPRATVSPQKLPKATAQSGDNGNGDRLLDGLNTPTAESVDLLHAAHMAQLAPALRALHALPGLRRLNGSDDDDDDDDNDDALLIMNKNSLLADSNNNGEDTPDYHAALDELAYLEGLFAKLRFSYREQLTKETVVRRILELELPLLHAADIDRMVQDTEVQRQRLRASKSAMQAQGAAAERLVRTLAAERQSLRVAAHAAAHNLPTRLRRLRHRLARLRVALRAELQAVDKAMADTADGRKPEPAPRPFACSVCNHRFYAEAFQLLHQAMHADVQEREGYSGIDVDDVDAPEMVDQHYLGLCTCSGCDEQVPAVLLDRLPAPEAGETHAAFHARLQQAMAHAQQTLATQTAVHEEDLALPAETAAVVEALAQCVAEATAQADEARADATRQAAVEHEAAQALAHLRDAVGCVRAEMARQEQAEAADEDDRTVPHASVKTTKRTHLGRTLQEQADVFGVLLQEDNDDDEEMME